MEMFNVFEDLLKIQDREYLEAWETSNHSLEDYEYEILRFLEVGCLQRLEGINIMSRMGKSL